MTSKNPSPAGAGTRRKFLKASSAATAGAALGFPMIAKGQTGPISMRWQSTWPAKDIFHEYANDFAKKVNDITGGDLKIEVLPDDGPDLFAEAAAAEEAALPDATGAGEPEPAAADAPAGEKAGG